MITINAPIKGRIIDLKEVPDPIFSEKMMGDGFAIDPIDGMVVAPCDGKIIHVFPTKHALGILTDDGLELLIHIGLETVHLNGKGFKSYVEAGQTIVKGQKLIKFNLKALKKSVKSIVTPIVITNMDLVKNITVNYKDVTIDTDSVMEIELK